MNGSMKKGPDPDNPPWAGRKRGEDGDEESSEANSEETTEDQEKERAERAEKEDRSHPVDEVTAGTEREGAHTQLAEVADQPPRQQLPKRTGVFLDPEDLQEHVGGLLRVLLGGYQVDAWGNFTFVHEGARVFITVSGTPIGPTVGVFSVTNIEVELTPQLAGFLLTTNNKLGFGSFSYDGDNQAIWLRHTLLGTTLDPPELQSAVAAIASAAAHFDDVIEDRFGGRTFHDAPEDVQRHTKPPESDQSPAGPGGASGYL